MSGAELPIAVVSFFFQAFAGCIQGYELIADACRLEKDAQALLVNFKIEQHRLIDWARQVQLDYTEERLVLNHISRPLIKDIFDQQNRLLASFGRLDHRYQKLTKPLFKERPESFVVDSDRLLENGVSSTTENDDIVQFPPADELVKKAQEWISKAQNVPKRIRWASWDKEKMGMLIQKLENYNDKMHQALDKAQMDNLLEMQTRTHYQIVLMNRQMENMVQLFQSDRIAHQHTQGLITNLDDSDYDFDFQNISGLSTRSRTQPLGALAQQRFVQLAIEDSQTISEEYGNSIDLPHLAHNIRDTKLSLANIKPALDQSFPEEIEEGDRTEATYNGSSVWIEWKPNEPSPSAMDNKADPKIEARVQKLAALLAQNNRKVRFRAPHCLGYFVDESEDRESRFGLVFEKPASTPKGTEATTLHALIEAANMPGSNTDVPSLTDRITLMRLLSETVERLHAVDWLHKGLRSTNILFFPSSSSTTPALSDPYISGFDYSRPATRDDMTERPSDNPRADVYRHPTVQSCGNRDAAGGRASYKKSFDLYALGIVLLEIAYWKTIDDILGIDLEKAKPKQTWPVRNRLLVDEPGHLRWVRSRVGNTVEGVIRACLEGAEAFGLPAECDERRGVVAAALQEGFGEKVVRRLGGIKGF